MTCIIRGHGAKTTYWIDGKQVSKEEFDAVCPDKPLGGAAALVGWKKLGCDALAVHPDQVKDAIELSIQKGVPTHFDAEGTPQFESKGHYTRFLRAYGYFNKDGNESPRNN